MFAALFLCCLHILGNSSSTETTIINSTAPGPYQMPPGPPPGQFAGQPPAYGYNAASASIYAVPQPGGKY